MSGSATFVPSSADAVAVSRSSFLRSLQRWRFRVRLILIAMVGTIGGILFDWLVDAPIVVAHAIAGALAAVAWIAALLTLTFLLLPRRARRLFRQQRTLDREFVFSWTDTGVDFSSDVSRSAVIWADYHDGFETAAVFGFGLNEQLYHWVPKRALADEQVLDLRRTAGRRFPGLG